MSLARLFVLAILSVALFGVLVYVDEQIDPSPAAPTTAAPSLARHP